MNVWIRGLIAVVLVAVLSGCGGGGGGSNTPPVANKVTLSTYKDVTISGRFDVSDKEDTHFKYYLVDSPKHGTVVIDENNPAFAYTPKEGFAGQDSFSYKVYDGKAYSSPATVVIAIASVPTSTSDAQAPTKPVLFSANTLSPTAMTLFWLPVRDDTLAPEKIRYEVHCDTAAGFTPSDATRKTTVMGAAEADIKGLEKSTTYYVKIRALDAAGNAAVSNEINITTPDAASIVKLNPNAKIAKADDLFLHDTQVHSDEIVVPKTSKTKPPAVGSIYFGDAKDQTLRKVVSANESGDTIVIKTKKASLVDAVDTLSLKSQTLMIPKQEMPTPQSTGRMGRLMSGYALNGIHTDTYQWPSNRLQIAQTNGHATVPSVSASTQRLGKEISDTDDGLTITAAQEKLIAYPERFNFIDINLQQTDGIKIGKFYIKSVEHDGEDIACTEGNMKCGIFRLETYDWHTSSAKGRLVIDHPSKSDISDKPYKVTLFAKQDEGTFSVDDEVEVPLDIYIVSADSDIDTSKKDTLDLGGLDATATADLTFTPMVSTEVEIKNMSLTYGKISVGGKLELNIDAVLKYEKEATLDKTFDLGSKKFTQIYMAGEIPVYQEITLSWAAEVTGAIHGEIEQTTNLTKVFQANFGLEYRDGQWTPLTSKGGDTDLTASIKVGAGGELEVRLVPTINIRFYRAVSSEMSIEPWGKVSFEAHGKATFNTDFDSYDTMVQYGLDNLTATAGLDLNLYASLDVFDYNILRYPAKDCGESDGCIRTGYKNILALQKEIFSLPQLSIDTDAQIVPDHNMTIVATIEDGANNPFDDDSIQWRIFPANGATITPDPRDPRKATVRFSKFDEYQVVFAGSSKRLGTTFGRQYTTMTLDARDTDGDGMADAWESEHGFNPDDGTDGQADRDGDGFTNKQEYLALTDPQNPDDHPDGDPNTDTTLPTITIAGDNPVTITVGDSYTDAGASAVDAVDGNVTVHLVRNTVDTSTAGDYVVVYSATDAAGNEANATRTVHVVAAATNQPPTANAGADQQVASGATVTLDGSGSNDSDGQIVSYVWTENGSQVGTGESVALDNVPDGVHTYTLTVTDDGNATDSDSVVVTVGSSDNNLEWITQIASPIPSSPVPASVRTQAIETDANGNIYVVGYKPEKDSQGSWRGNMFLGKFSNNGEKIYFKSYLYNEGDYPFITPRNMIIDNNSIYISGDISAGQGYQRFVYKLNRDGDVIWKNVLPDDDHGMVDHGERDRWQKLIVKSNYVAMIDYGINMNPEPDERVAILSIRKFNINTGNLISTISKEQSFLGITSEDNFWTRITLADDTVNIYTRLYGKSHKIMQLDYNFNILNSITLQINTNFDISSLIQFKNSFYLSGNTNNKLVLSKLNMSGYAEWQSIYNKDFSGLPEEALHVNDDGVFLISGSIFRRYDNRNGKLMGKPYIFQLNGTGYKGEPTMSEPHIAIDSLNNAYMGSWSTLAKISGQ